MHGSPSTCGIRLSAASGPAGRRGKGPDASRPRVAPRRAVGLEADPTLDALWTDLARVIAAACSRRSTCEVP